jgi:nucleotide-binding universal stress UspA family protein
MHGFLDPMTDTAPVLIAYDGSDLAKLGIRQAGELLQPGLEAVVLTVWDFPVAVGIAPMAADVDEFSTSLAKDAARVAADGARLADEQGFEATPLVSRGAPTWDLIVREAEERGAQVIVIGSHGRSGIAYAVLGSVATAVAHHAPCAVLIAHSPDAEPRHDSNGNHAAASSRADTSKETH